MNDAHQASYDEFPYLSLAFPQSHPDRMATLGRLHGLPAAQVDECRVLEIGCASGGNLIPMAAGLPRSRFTGIDFSAVQLRQGAADIAALGLANIELTPMDLLDFDRRCGSGSPATSTTCSAASLPPTSCSVAQFARKALLVQ
ncbi:MAG: class I SAM-dependent methyltransferase [Casimicrobiaceae bacterium]